VQYLNNVSSSIGAVLTPAGLEKSVGIITTAYLKDYSDEQWANDPAVKRWESFMKKYYPAGDLNDGSNIRLHVARTLEQVLKQCGDNLTRENVMKQAASMKGHYIDTLLPGITITTSDNDYAPIESVQMQRFNGKRWERFGGVMVISSAGRALRARLPAVFLLLQQAPLHFAGGRFRQRIDELDDARILVRGHFFRRPADDVLSRYFAARIGLQHDNRFHRFAAVRIARCDDARLLHGRMLIQQALHFRRPDLEARGIDHALQPIDQEEVAVLVGAREIASAEETPAVDFDERFRVAFGLFQYPTSTCGPFTMISPTSPGGSSRKVSGSTTRASTSKIGMPRHCFFGRSGGLMWLGAIVSVSP